MKNTLAERIAEAKNTVVRGYHELLEPRPELHQVWQPYPIVRDEACQRQLEDGLSKKCLTEYLEFPRDYRIVSLVLAKNCGEVMDIMINQDMHDVPMKFQRLERVVRCVYEADVIIDALGIPYFVTFRGFEEVRHVALD